MVTKVGEFEVIAYRVTSGDEVYLVGEAFTDFWPGTTMQLLGVTAPPRDTEAGEKSRLELNAWLIQGKRFGMTCEVYKTECGKLLARIFIEDCDGETVNVNEKMIALGYAKEYV